MINKALLLIDIQDGLDEVAYYGGQRNNPDAEANCRRVLNLYRERNWPIFHVKHNAVNPESPLYPTKQGNLIKAIVAPINNESIIEKNVNSAFVGTDLKERLDEQQIDDLTIVGLTTEHCVSTTARMAANLGFQVTVVSDATAAFNKVGVNKEIYNAEVIHLTSLATLNGEFARIVDTQTVLDEA